VILGAKAIFSTQIAELTARGLSPGRLSVDVASRPTVDRSTTQSHRQSTVRRAKVLLERKDLATVLVADMNLYCIATSLLVWLDANPQVLHA